MNTTSCELNNKKAILTLSVIALVFNLISDITYFITYVASGKYDYEATFTFSSFGLLTTLLSLAPYVLMILYIFKLRGTTAEAFTVPVIFISTAISACIALINFDSEIMNTIVVIGVLGVFGLATFGALNGLTRKRFILIPTITALALAFVSLLANIKYLKVFANDKMTAYILNYLSATIAVILLSVALLIFGLKNSAPSVLSAEKQDLNTLRPEQALKLLKNKFELGLITAEEYTTQRSHIIDSL